MGQGVLGALFVAQADLQLQILLPQVCVPLYLTDSSNLKKLKV